MKPAKPLSLFIIFIIILGFLWFIAKSQAYIVDESWSIDDGTPSNPGDRGGFRYDDVGDYVVYDDEGDGPDPDDPVVDDTVSSTEGGFHIRISVTAWKVVWKEAAWWPGVGFSGSQDMPMCREYEDDRIRVEKTEETALDLQSLIRPGQKVRDVVWRVDICMNVDFVSFPSGVELLQIYVGNKQVRGKYYPDTRIASIPAGKEFSAEYEVKAKYLINGEWYEYTFTKKIYISVEWKVERVFNRAVLGQDPVQRCIEMYSDDIHPLGFFHDMDDVIQYCQSQYGNMERIYTYDVKLVRIEAR